MRILFDQNVPDPLRRVLPGHTVKTLYQLGWGTLQNGLLLKTAEIDGFDLMVTADQNIQYQQHLSNRKIALGRSWLQPLALCQGTPARDRREHRRRKLRQLRIC